MTGGRAALLGCATGAWLAGLATLAALAFGGSSCGQAFTATSGGGSDGSAGGDVVALDVGAGETSGGDAGLGFCASQDAHTLCEDFSTGAFPDKFDKLGTTTGTVVADTVNTRSPPESARATTLAEQAAGSVASALIEHDFTLADSIGSHFTLVDWVRFDSTTTCLSPGQSVIIAQIAFPRSTSHYEIDVVALADSAAIVESTNNPAAASADGGPALTTHAFTLGALTLDAFASWTVDINLGPAKSASVTVAGTTGPPQDLTAATANDNFTEPSLVLGAAVAGVSGGCRLNVDDILFDIHVL